jgi:chaperonin GroES
LFSIYCLASRDGNQKNYIHPLIFGKPTLYSAVFKGSPQCRALAQQRATNIQSGWSSTIYSITTFCSEEEVMKIRPLNDRLLVKRLKEEEKTAGGIIIPDSAKEKPAEGEVMAVGPGKSSDKGERVAMQVKAGDRVLFSKYSGTDVKIEGEDYLIMREDDVLGIIE